MKRLLLLALLALAFLFALATLGPLLLLRHARKRSRRRLSREPLAQLLRLLETRDWSMLQGYHLCELPSCRAPIPNGSRRAYCSAACRGYARNLRESNLIADEVPF